MWIPLWFAAFHARYCMIDLPLGLLEYPAPLLLDIFECLPHLLGSQTRLDRAESPFDEGCLSPLGAAGVPEEDPVIVQLAELVEVVARKDGQLEARWHSKRVGTKSLTSAANSSFTPATGSVFKPSAVRSNPSDSFGFLLGISILLSSRMKAASTSSLGILVTRREPARLQWLFERDVPWWGSVIAVLADSPTTVSRRDGLADRL